MANPTTDLANSRLPDGGPLYTETDLSRHLIIEPWNTVTAIFFAVIAIIWFFNIKTDEPAKGIKKAAAIVLLIGGIGGTLFHGTRTHFIFLLLDVLPIVLLIIGYSLYLFNKLKMWPLAIGLIALNFATRIGGQYIDISEQARITLGYGISGLNILIPIILWLIKTKWINVEYVICALISFGLALTFRLLDSSLSKLDLLGTFPMGTHFLWHTFGAVATTLLIIYWQKSDRVHARNNP